MNVYTAIFHGYEAQGHALVIARDQDGARVQLDEAIAYLGLLDSQAGRPTFTFHCEAAFHTPAQCVILEDGRI